MLTLSPIFFEKNCNHTKNMILFGIKINKTYYYYK